MTTSTTMPRRLGHAPGLATVHHDAHRSPCVAVPTGRGAVSFPRVSGSPAHTPELPEAGTRRDCLSGAFRSARLRAPKLPRAGARSLSTRAERMSGGRLPSGPLSATRPCPPGEEGVMRKRGFEWG